MVVNHSRGLLRPWWRFLCSVYVCWAWNVPSYIQITYSRRCGSLDRDVLHMWHQLMCISDLGFLSLLSSYRRLFVLSIATLASIYPCLPWWSWSHWCIVMIPSPFRFKVYNTALIIVTQPKKEEFPIQLTRISQCSIFHSNIQNHFCLKLSSIGELKF